MGGVYPIKTAFSIIHRGSWYPFVSFSGSHLFSCPCTFVQSMTLAKGTHIVAMCLLPAGIVPHVSSDGEDDDEPADAGTSSDATAATAEEEGEEGDDEPEVDEAEGPCLLFVSERGLGKRVPISEFPVRLHRRGKGARAIRLNPEDRLAGVQAAGIAPTGRGGVPVPISSDDGGHSSVGNADVLLSTQQGLLVRVPISNIRKVSRIAKGSRVVKVGKGDAVAMITILSK